jgi:hypothetical protein
MLAALRTYYERVGIAAERFRCAHRESCESRCTDLVSPREAFVGSAYESGVLPRLLFLSLDPADDRPGREVVSRQVVEIESRSLLSS